MKTKTEIKNEAKNVVKKNFKNILVGLIPVSLAYLLMSLKLGLLSTVAEIIWCLILYGILLICLNAVNNDNCLTENPLKDSFMIFSKKYFWPTIKLVFMSDVLILAWSLLLIVPGIIKSFAYSQAFFIMKEHIDNGEKVTARQCITESKRLMDGQKGKFFVLVLSFMGWIILSSLVIGFVSSLMTISNIFIIVLYVAVLFFMVLLLYIYYSKALFYRELVDNKNN
ncbi:DUF975 family protein [Ligilactobacillus aviarius]|uniref:DUF975 family protein n=1 Tax=Ligilactobacillus aviarius TaxID=1606 RepID=UPI0024BBB0B6|nr:DUF975 family protein [Ligilactobacillus aviarius]